MVREWFDPIPAFIIVLVYTYIIIAIEEQIYGGDRRFSSLSKDSYIAPLFV